MSLCISDRDSFGHTLTMEALRGDLEPTFVHHHPAGSSASSGISMPSNSRSFTSSTDDSNIPHFHRNSKHYDRSLNFNLPSSIIDEYELHPKRQKTSRDPQSHRIIEKRRRDRMNNCLGDLSKLIPSSYLKQGQGRIEKTEIIELAIVHIKRLQAMIKCLKGDARDDHDRIICQENFLMGFKECAAEVMRFLVEVEGHNAADSPCVKLRNYLEAQSQKFSKRSADMKLEGRCDRSMWKAAAETTKSAPPTDESITSNIDVIEAQQIIARSISANFDDMSNDRRDSCDALTTSGISESTIIKNEENFKHNSERSSPSSSSSKEIYKFKNDIKQRFTSRRKEPMKQSDSSSSSCSRDEQRFYRSGLKRPLSRSSESTAYPISELSGNSADSGMNPDMKMDTNKDQDDKNDDMLVPAFALHPSGTHYVPVAVHLSKLSQCSGGPQSTASMFHPISIPVNFSGSFIGVRNLNIQSSVKIENTSSSTAAPPILPSVVTTNTTDTDLQLVEQNTP